MHDAQIMRDGKKLANNQFAFFIALSLVYTD